MVSVLEKFFLLLLCCFSVMLSEYCLIQGQKVYSYLFSEELITALITFGFVIHIELLFVYGVRCRSLASYALLHLVIQLPQQHLLKIDPTILSWDSYSESIDCKCEDLFTGSRFCAIELYVYPHAICLSLCQYLTVLITVPQ